MLTELEKENYVANPYHCPYCQNEDIVADHFEPEGAYSKVECKACGKQWREIFDLIDMEEID